MSWRRDIAGGIDARRAVGVEQILTCPFGDDHNGVVAVIEPSLEGGEKTVLAVQGERTLGYQDEVCFLGGPRGHAGDVTGIPAHEFHEPDPSDRAAGLGVCQVNDVRATSTAVR